MAVNSTRAKFLLKLGIWPSQESSGVYTAEPGDADAEILEIDPLSGGASSSTGYRHSTQRHTTLIMVDWDDTLLCTTHLTQNPQSLSPSALLSLSTEACSFLTAAAELGDARIVTNASKGWVEKSGETWLPEVLQVIRKLRIPVISARTKFEKKLPGDPVAWKCEAFALLKENSRQIANLISVGDSEAEMKAVVRLAQLYRTSFTKTIRLKESPSATELARQLQIITPKLRRIVEKAENLRISLHQKKRETKDTKESTEEPGAEGSSSGGTSPT